MDGILENKIAVVTGAGRGIGRSIALALAQQGAKVVVNDLGTAANGTGSSATPADEVVHEIRSGGGIAVASYDSVATFDGGRRVIQPALDEYGRIDILVNNAGILRDRMVFNMAEEEWDAVIAVHLKGYFACTKHACMVMRQQRSGRIINMSSSAGLGNMGQANYSAAKEGVVGLTRTVARDMGRYGVTCNAIRPRAATRLSMSPELQQAWERLRKTGGVGEGLALDASFKPTEHSPDDVAPFVVFLASDEAANINGCVFFVHGGLIGLYPEPTPVRTIYKSGRWSLDELVPIVPSTLAQGLVNPAPPKL